VGGIVETEGFGDFAVTEAALGKQGFGLGHEVTLAEGRHARPAQGAKTFPERVGRQSKRVCDRLQPRIGQGFQRGQAASF